MAIEKIEVPRWWLANMRKSFQVPLPSGQLGDTLFLLEYQLGDLIAAHDKAAQDQRDVASRFDASG